jgi:hypothetical protein
MGRGISSELATGVAQAIRACWSGDVDRPVLDRLALLAARIVQQRLWGRICAAANARDVSIEQEALSVVTPLFAGKPPDIWLCEALEDKLDSDDTTLFLKFQAVVIRCATQELFHRWSETDPQSAKLWRNLNRAIKCDGRLLVFPHNKPEYVALSTMAAGRCELQLIEFESLRTSLSSVGDCRTPIADTVVDLLSKEECPGKNVVIRIEDLFRALRESIFSGSMEIALSESLVSNRDPCTAIALERATDSATAMLQEYLNRYAKSGKFDDATCANLAGALMDVLKDCADGGPAVSYYEYILQHMPGLSRNRYQAKYRTRFEYLAEKVQKEFYDTLRRELIE